MDTDTRILLDKIGIVLGFLLMGLAIVGEVLGWWNDLGILIGGAGLLATLYSAADVHGLTTVRILGPMAAAIAGLHEKSDRMLDAQDRMLDGQDRMLDGQDKLVEGQDKLVGIQGDVLTVNRHVLVKQDAGVTALDRITEILDERLGVDGSG